MPAALRRTRANATLARTDRQENDAMTPRRSLLAAPLALALPTPLRAQQGFPDRPVRIVVPFPPGGAVDLTARVLAEMLPPLLNGQSIVVENRGGAGGNLGADLVAKAPKDGHTLLLGTATILAANKFLFRRSMPFDPAADLAPVTRVTTGTVLLVVNASRPWRTFADLVAAAKAAPGRISMGSSGNGSVSHLTLVALNRAAGIEITHVPYRGGGPAIQDLVAGNLNTVFVTVASAAPQLASGQIRGLGVMATERMRSHPDIPTFREQGIDLVAEHWWGLLAPRGTPEAVVARIAAAMPGVLRAPEMAARLDALAVIARPDGPGPFGERIRQDIARYGEIARSRGITAQ
jgi:tripartite-type tricarboxylate transporter receptor subunit TctC